ncbi:MAG: hypothetical protein WCE49_09675 [Terrimicrobiaceae bacterium]
MFLGSAGAAVEPRQITPMLWCIDHLAPGTSLNYHTKTEVAVAKTGVVGVAEGRQQNVAVVIAPRTAAQHAQGRARFVLVLAPLPDIPSQIVDAQLVRTEASYQARE